MPQTDHDRTIALAGLFQATDLVREIAHHGQANADDFETCIGSIFKTEADTSEDVYDGLTRLRTGLRLLTEQLQNPPDLEITRYSVALLLLERRLGKQPRALAKIAEGLHAAAEKLQYFPLTHDNIIASLAEIYASTISTLSPRIMVHGAQIHLARPDNANRIRALLLAGIRAARLWRQSGGSRMKLFLRRKSLLQQAHRALASLEQRV
jgi:high frequency lysogenization protein